MQIGGVPVAKYTTKQRKRLMEYLSEHTDEEMTARKIAAALTGEHISLSAVYRNLSALEAEGMVRRCVSDQTGEAAYQYIAPEACKASLHLSCRLCKKSIHLNAADTEALLQAALEHHGFQIEKTETVLYGICEHCRKQSPVQIQ